MSRLRSTLAIALIAAASLAAAPPRAAPQQPDPAARVHVESTEVNLSQTPSFTFAILLPTVLHFEAVEAAGQRFLHIWAISRVDSLNARIRRAAEYMDARPGIFTPLFETPNRQPIMGYVDRLQFERALRDLLPTRRLSYNWRLNT